MDTNNVNVTESNEEPVSKAIFSMAIARALLKKGCQIVDIKPRRDDPKMFLPFFRDDTEFQLALGQVLRERKRAKRMRELAEKETEEVKEPLEQED